MYDKLGDLLSETLDSGIVFSEPKVEKSTIEKDSPEEKAAPETAHKSEGEHENVKARSAQTSGRKKAQKKKPRIDPSFLTADNVKKSGEILRFSQTPQNIVQAFDFFKISPLSTYEETKKAYREKLMYFHPDKWGDNAVLQKIAKEKTEQIIYFWKLLEDWFKDSCP